jgi:hypothetical protein
MAAKMGRPASLPNFADGGTAPWTWLTGFAMHHQEIAHLHVNGITHACAEGLDRVCQHTVHGRVEPGNIPGGEAGATTKRVEPSTPAYLVGVGISNACHEGLIDQ